MGIEENDGRPVLPPRGLDDFNLDEIQVEATGDLRRQLLEQAAKIPFDDRHSSTGTAENISPILVKKFLADIRSHLSEMDFPPQEIFRKLRLVVPVNDHEIPRNVALLFLTMTQRFIFVEHTSRLFISAMTQVEI